MIAPSHLAQDPRRCLLLATLLLSLSSGSSHAQQPSPHRHAADALQQARKLGLLEGIVRVELIRPDLLSVTIDGGLVPGSALLKGGSSLGATAEMIQKPDGFLVSSPRASGFQNGVKPSEVFRNSYEWFNATDVVNTWPLVAAGPVLRHDYYLKLPNELPSGHTYTVTVQSEPLAGTSASREFAYDARSTTTKAIKINQIAYSSVATQRYAYLGWWAGDGGSVDYSDFDTFSVHATDTGSVVLNGSIVQRARNHALSGEHVYEMDLSRLRPGSYRIMIPKFATSEIFHVGGEAVFERFYHTARVFFHQRCGQELREPWTAVSRSACHCIVAEDGKMPAEVIAITHNPGRNREPAEVCSPNADTKRFRGGYHDAADFDTFAYHLPAISQLLAIYELHPTAFTDGQLNLPESGNGIPDVLDEAVWAVSFYVDSQYPDGAIPLGRINLSDALQQNFEGGKEAPMPPFGIIPPMRESTPMFAAVAAQVSRLIRPFDKEQSDRLLAAATRAFDVAERRGMLGLHQDYYSETTPIVLERNNEGNNRYEPLFAHTMVWAAAELLRATGQPRYNHYVQANRTVADHWDCFEAPRWSYLQANASVTDAELRDQFRKELLSHRFFGADALVSKTAEGGYRMVNGNGREIGWGRAQGINLNQRLIYAFELTGDQKYFDAVALNADWHCGTNPISQTFLTSMGYRYPNRPEISWYLYQDRTATERLGNTIMGYPIYGFGPPLRTYPGDAKDKGQPGWPLWRSWRDIWGFFAEIYSEFTIHQTVGPASSTYAYLYTKELQTGILSPATRPQYPLGGVKLPPSVEPRNGFNQR